MQRTLTNEQKSNAAYHFRLAIKAWGIKQSDIAKRLGVSKSYISNILSARSQISEKTLDKLDKLMPWSIYFLREIMRPDLIEK